MLQNNPQTKNNRAQQTAESPTSSDSATLVMCPPDFFDVTYQINPWMDLDTWSAQADTWREKAKTQWNFLKQTYEQLGHKVHVIKPAIGQPDMVFMANSATILDGKAILAHFRHAERQGEEAYYQIFYTELQARGIIDSIKNLPQGLAFEGCGDAVWDPSRHVFWVGYSQRTSPHAPDHLARTFDVETIALEMVSARYYHLDVALAPLTGGQIVYLPDAFSAEGRRIIQDRVAPNMLIEATAQDAESFAVNLVNIGKDVILSGASETLQTALVNAGYSLHFVPTDAFQLAGGSVFCLTQRLDHKRCRRPNC